MPLGQFPQLPSAPRSNMSTEEIIQYLTNLSDSVALMTKEVTYLLNGGLDTLNVNELSADVINAGVLNALLVVIKGLSGGKFFQIDANGIVANNGTVDTMKFDLTTGLLTLVSVLIQSATGYPKLEFNSASNVFAAYSSATDAVKLVPIYSSGPPAWLFDIGGSTKGTISMVSGSFAATTLGTTNLNLQSAQDASLVAVRDAVLESTRDTLLKPTGDLKINGTAGWTGTFDVVADVNFVAQTVNYTRVTVKKGIITNVAAV